MAKHTQPGDRGMLAKKRPTQTKDASKKVRFPARPKPETDLGELRRTAKAKFPKTIARLAE